MSPLRRTLSFLLPLACAVSAPTQCAQEWQPGEPLPQLRGPVNATAVFDIDGAGPLPSMLVACGAFDAGAYANTRLVAWDGTQWVGFPSVPSGDFRTLGLWNGQLVVGGNAVWTYDGSAWSLLATVGGGYVEAVTSLNGELVVAGSFTDVGGVPAAHVARLSTSGWVAFGAGVPGTVHAAVIWNGLLHVGGNLVPGSSTAANLQAWNGTSWVAVGSWNGPIETLAVRSALSITNSYLFAGGSFTVVNGTLSAPLVARFNASTGAWSAMGALGTASGATSCKRLFVRGVGVNSYELTAGVGGSSNSLCWRWNGTAWTDLGNVPTGINPPVAPSTIQYFGGNYFVGLAASQQQTPSALYRLDASWGSVRVSGIEGDIFAVGAFGDDAVVSGTLNAIAGLGPLHNIARGRPGHWFLLGSGLGGGSASAFATLPNGDLVVGGSFVSAGGAPASHIARWDGSNWYPLGAGVDALVTSLAVLPDGDLVAAGSFTTAGGVAANHVARWDGSAWSALGAGVDDELNKVVVLPNGDVVVGGLFANAGGAPALHVARWDGTAWFPLGAGLNGPVYDLAVDPDGGLWSVGGYRYSGATFVTRLAYWDGIAWSSAPPPPGLLNWSNGLSRVAALPDGSIVVGGGLQPIGTGPGPASSTWRLAGGTWSNLAVDDTVTGLAVGPHGELFAAGRFLGTGPVGSFQFAELASTCPASATDFGSSCTGSAGPVALAARTLPWDAGTLRTRATGLPPLSFAVVLWGFTQVNVPLAAVLAEGLPGCLLSTTPDVFGLALPVAGTVDSEIFVAPQPSLVGVPFFHQVVPFEFDATGTITAITASNGLALTVGSY